MLFELATGNLLFATHDSYQHMALIVSRLEKRIPYSLVKDCEKKQFFAEHITADEQILNLNIRKTVTDETVDSRVG